MSRHVERVLTLSLILALIGVIFWQRKHPAAPPRAVAATRPELRPPIAKAGELDESAARTRHPSETEVDRDALARAENRIAELEQQLGEFPRLEELARPLETEVRSAAVNTTIGADETLVTGGYQTPDGQTHFLFLQPKRHTLNDGRVAVKIESTQFALSPEQLEGSELADLATNAGNTLQHGEAWKNAETSRVMKAMREAKSVDRLSAPSVITMPGQQAEISVGKDFRYSITPDFHADGDGIDLQMRMEHAPPPQETNEEAQL